MDLLGHQQIAELAVFVGLIRIEPTLCVHHLGSRSLVKPLHRSQSGRQADPSPAGGWVVHFRGGDHDGSGVLLQSFNQELMG